MAKLTITARKAPEKKNEPDKVLGKNANRAADRVVARMSKSKPVR